jgi:hypothetical protein
MFASMILARKPTWLGWIELQMINDTKPKGKRKQNIFDTKIAVLFFHQAGRTSNDEHTRTNDLD